MSRSPAEVIAEALHDWEDRCDEPFDVCFWRDEHAIEGEYLAAALVDAGWVLFRPDECATTKDSGRRGGGRRSESRYYLVPVEGENP